MLWLPLLFFSKKVSVPLVYLLMLFLSLIPQSIPERMTIARQIEQVRVNVATEISKTFLLNLDGTEVHGNPVRGQVSLSYAESLLNILMIEECAEAKCPPHELVTLIAEACKITDMKHFSLLYTVLSNSNMESIISAFTQQGMHVKGLVLGILFYSV